MDNKSSDLTRHYEEGNQYFKCNDFEKAIIEYTNGLKLVREDDECDLRLKLLLNRSQCYIQQRNFDVAIVDCSQALTVDNRSIKALMRRSIAYENLNEFNKALNDIETLLIVCEQDNNHNSSIISKLLSSRRRLQKYVNNDELVSRNEGVPTSLVTSQQTLRLNVSDSPDQLMNYDTLYEFKLFIGNEFNLWDRNLYNSIKDSRLECDTMYIQNQCDLNSQVTSQVTTTDISEINASGKFLVKVKVSLDKTGLTKHEMSRHHIVIFKFSLQNISSGSINVLAVLSLPITLVDVSSADFPLDSLDICSLGSTTSASCIREVEIDTQFNLYVFEAPYSRGIAGKIWDSSYVLMEYLKKFGKHYIQDKRVVELGCGTGIVGLGIAALCPTLLILTDFLDIVPLISANIQLNSCLQKNKELLEIYSSKCHALSHTWGENVDESIQSCDVIIGSDIVYDPIGYEPLVKTISTILADDLDKTCILAHRKRHPEDHKFFDFLTAYNLNVDTIPFQTSSVYGKETLKDVNLFRIYRGV